MIAGKSKRGGIKLEPLSGQFFDIKPSKSGKNSPKLGGRNDFFRFAVISIIAFLVLGVSNAYVLGRELVFEGQKAAYEGYGNIKLGVDSLLAQNPVGAREYFLKAESAFYELSQTAQPLTSQENHLLAESLYLDTTAKLIESALEVTKIGQELAGLMQDFSTLPQAAMAVVGGEDGGLIEALSGNKQTFDGILVLAASLQRKMTTINDAVLPEELRIKIGSARAQIGRLMALMLDADENYDVLLRLLGDKVPHRYLILLQNSRERRATGGFIGSYLVADMNDGKLARLDSKDVYETDGQLKDVVEPPPGIDRVADRLYMRDANYSPDFPTSAKNIMWFLEHSKGPSVDTVIAIDQTVVERLLALTGPLALDGFPFQVRADNFTDTISFFTEAKLSDSVSPKQLLFDLIPALQKELAGQGGWPNLLVSVKELVDEGHIQAYSGDSSVQRLIARAGLDGAMTKADKKTDYLSVITTSIGGNKSDQYIKTNLHHRSVVGSGGRIEDELTIQKTHTFSDDDRSKIKDNIGRYGTGQLNEESLMFILGAGDNLDHMRVYVPEGSQLEDVTGFDITSVEVSREMGYTVFAFPFGPLKAGESAEVKLRYLLPFKIASGSEENYKFIAEPQAGAENITLKKELIVPDSPSATPILETIFDRNQIFISTGKHEV